MEREARGRGRESTWQSTTLACLRRKVANHEPPVTLGDPWSEYVKMHLQDHRGCPKIIVIISYVVTRTSSEQCSWVTFSMFRPRAGEVTGVINSQKGTQVLCAKGFSGQKWSTNSQNNMKESWCFRAKRGLRCHLLQWFTNGFKALGVQQSCPGTCRQSMGLCLQTVQLPLYLLHKLSFQIIKKKKKSQQHKKKIQNPLILSNFFILQIKKLKWRKGRQCPQSHPECHCKARLEPRLSAPYLFSFQCTVLLLNTTGRQI